MAITGTLRYTRPADNIASTATVTVQAGGPVVTGYEVTYLTDFSDLNLGRPCLSSSTQMSLQLDFGSAQTIAGILIWHNLDDAATMTVQGNSAASWGAPAYSATITIPAKRGDGRFKKVWIAPGQSLRYWLLKSPTNSVNPGFKAQFYTSLRSFTGISSGQGGGQQFGWGTRRPNAQFGIDLTTDFNYHWAYDFGVGSESISGPISLTDADYDSLAFMHQASGGRKPVLFVPDSGSSEAWLARLTLGPSPHSFNNDLYTSVLDRPYTSPNHNIVQLSAEDVTAGGPEWT